MENNAFLSSKKLIQFELQYETHIFHTLQMRSTDSFILNQRSARIFNTSARPLVTRTPPDATINCSAIRATTLLNRLLEQLTIKLIYGASSGPSVPRRANDGPEATASIGVHVRTTRPFAGDEGARARRGHKNFGPLSGASSPEGRISGGLGREIRDCRSDVNPTCFRRDQRCSDSPRGYDFIGSLCANWQFPLCPRGAPRAL